MKKAVLYLNQFFGQIGGEGNADQPPITRTEPIGPGTLLNTMLDGAKIVATVICGDNYIHETPGALQEVVQEIASFDPDIVIAGPAFNAGRYGLACGLVCTTLQKDFRIPAVTSLYEENPAVDMIRKEIWIARAGFSAGTMRKSLRTLADLVHHHLNGTLPTDPKEIGCLPQGRRINFFDEKSGAQRAIEMLEKKLAGEPYQSEIPLPVYESIVPAAPIRDLSRAKIALVTSGGIVPIGNPDHLQAATAKNYFRYDLPADGDLSGKFFSVHAGYDTAYANEDPNRVLPADVLLKMATDGEIGSFVDRFFVTTGNSTAVSDAQRMGAAIAAECKEENIDGVIMTST